MAIRKIKAGGALTAVLAAALLLSGCSLFNVIGFNVGLAEKGSVSYHMSGGLYPFGGKYLMLVGSLDARIVVLDVSDPANAVRLVNNDLSLGLGGGPVAFKDLVCYGMGSGGSVRIVDFSADPAKPVLADASFIASGALAIAVEGSTLAVLEADGINLYSLADPLKPAAGKSLALAGPFAAGSTVLMDRSRMAVAGTDEIFLLSWSDASTIDLKGSFPIDAPIPAKQCSGMAYNGNLLYYLTSGGIVPVNIADQAAPKNNDEYDLGEIFTATPGKFSSGGADCYLAVLNGMMVISSYYHVKVFHLFNPLKPNELETDATRESLDRCLLVDGMAATDEYLYVGMYGNPGSLRIFKW